MVLLKGFRRSTFPVFCLLALLVSSLLRVDAQDFLPMIGYSASSVFIEGKAMYITGGTNTNKNISQTFSIDLSSPWTIAAPKFTKQNAVRSPTDYQIPSALDKDQTNWLLVSRTTLYRYHIADDEWSTFGTLPNLFNVDDVYLQAAVDPVSNNFLIPNGYITQSATGPISSMMQYDIKNDKTSSISMANGPINHTAASVVWSKHIKKLVMFGGLINKNTINTLHTYDSTSGWTAITPINAGPSPRAFHCAVVANNGSKMVVFGGQSNLSTDSRLGDIYVLDLVTWTWSAGTPLSSDLSRYSTACGATGDYFISWGGSQNDEVVTSNITLLFNIKTMSWTDSFVPPLGVVPPSEEKKSNIGLIAGVAAGVVVLLAIVGFIFYRRSKRHQDGKRKNGKDGDEAGGVTVVPISAIDANHIWQPPTIAPQPDPSMPSVDTNVLQNRHRSPYESQQPVNNQQQQMQYLNYDQQQPDSTWPSPTVLTDGSPVTTGYSNTAYSPYQQQLHQYNDGVQAYKGDDGYIPPPTGSDKLASEYKVEHKAENANRASITSSRAPQAPQLYVGSPPDLENKTSSGVTVRNSYAE